MEWSETSGFPRCESECKQYRERTWDGEPAPLARSEEMGGGLWGECFSCRRSTLLTDGQMELFRLYHRLSGGAGSPGPWQEMAFETEFGGAIEEELARDMLYIFPAITDAYRRVAERKKKKGSKTKPAGR